MKIIIHTSPFSQQKHSLQRFSCMMSNFSNCYLQHVLGKYVQMQHSKETIKEQAMVYERGRGAREGGGERSRKRRRERQSVLLQIHAQVLSQRKMKNCISFFHMHSVLHQHCYTMLTISIHLSTSYTACDNYSNDFANEGTRLTNGIWVCQLLSVLSKKVIVRFPCIYKHMCIFLHTESNYGNQMLAIHKHLCLKCYLVSRLHVGGRYFQFGRVLLNHEDTATASIVNDSLTPWPIFS